VRAANVGSRSGHAHQRVAA